MLAEGEDFYIENGYRVFTEAYHLKRGYCCGNGCRHCPYTKEDIYKKKTYNGKGVTIKHSTDARATKSSSLAD
jgi:hypothetical protein